jgi:hypothetical protein
LPAEAKKTVSLFFELSSTVVFSEYHFKYEFAEVSEPQFYRQFKAWIESGDTNWKHLTGQLSDYGEKKFDALTSGQQAYFRRLAEKLINRVDTDIGADKFYGTREGFWNIVYWVSFLLDLSKVNLPTGVNDCILPVNIPEKKEIWFFVPTFL